MGWKTTDGALTPGRSLFARAFERGSLRAVARIRGAAVTLLGIVILGGVALSACAGELPNPGLSTTIPGPAGTTTTTTPQGALLGDQIGATWSEAIQELVPLLEGTPPASALGPTVAEVKEKYIQKMVALGRAVETLDQAGREAAWDHAAAVLEGTAESEWFKSYVRLYDQYAAAGDQTTQEFAVLLSTFNTLTQYAFFELLKAQEPEEARRLGIE
jgi:hypothetical protein